LLVRLRSEFGVNLSLRQLFEAPTAERLASLVEMSLGQEWLAGLWAELLGRNHIQLDDNFFDLGGKSELLASVQGRIAAATGRQIPIDQLLANPTVRQQVELMKSPWQTHPVLPPGVLALQPKGTRNSIFWIHYFNVNLAKLVGDDQPFLVVRLMAEDFVSLGETPTFESIAACHVHKILSTQAHGPYTVGGLCLGGVLAFEVAQQLRAAGHEVSLLIMLDPPGPSHLDSPRRLRPKLSQPRYLLKRAARLGLKTSFMKIRKRVFERFMPSLEAVSPRTEVKIAQEAIEAAAPAYQPRQYDGKVLLLLASERPPHLDFLPAWRAVVPSSLHIQYLDGHHEELTRGPSGQRVADAIFSHLVSAAASDNLMARGRAQTFVME
jgi:thioesterase domain-containing protein/aryl carrier-like protein